MSDEAFNVEDAAAALPMNRQTVAAFRACKTLGIEAEWNEDGSLAIMEEDGILEEDEFLEAFAEELKRMVLQDHLDHLVREGMIEGSVNEDGEVCYALTPDGARAVEAGWLS